jgi:hypothetical protein
MKESFSERLAIYTGPESYGVVREDNVGALTGESAGWVFSRKTYTLRNADAFGVGGTHQSDAPLSRGVSEFRAVADPEHVPKYLAREPGDPSFSHSENGLGRIGKSEDVRR